MRGPRRRREAGRRLRRGRGSACSCTGETRSTLSGDGVFGGWLGLLGPNRGVLPGVPSNRSGWPTRGSRGNRSGPDGICCVRRRLRRGRGLRGVRRPAGKRNRPRPGTGPTCGGWGRDRTGDLSLFRRSLVPTELPSHAVRERIAAVLTGFEPAASTLTGWRALQTAPQDQAVVREQVSHRIVRAPNGIRTRATALKGRRPGPLDDEG